MSEWKEKYLHDIVDVDPEQLNSSIDGDYSFFYIDISSVTPGNITYPDSQIKFNGSPSRARKVLQENDILMSNVRPNLKAFAQFKKKSKFNFIASTGFSILRAKPDTDIDFIFQCLFSKDLEKQIDLLVAGTAYPAINSSAVRKLKLKIPSASTQRHIAHILSTCDAVIEKTQSAIAKYKAIKQGMLQDLFTRGVVSEKVKVKSEKGEWMEKEVWKLRPRYEDAPELYKESKLGWIPREWEVLPVSSVSENLDGTRTPVKQEDRDKQQEVYPYYGASGIIDYVQDYIFDEPLILIGEDGENVISRNLPLAFKVSGKIWVNNHAHVLRPVLTMVNIDFLCEILESINYSNIVSGTAQPKITQGALSGVLLSIPKMDEQILMSEKIIAITNKLQTEQSYLQKMQLVKKGLMEDLLSGKKCLNLDLQDERINQDSKTILQSGNLVNQDADNYPVNPKIE